MATRRAGASAENEKNLLSVVLAGFGALSDLS